MCSNDIAVVGAEPLFLDHATAINDIADEHFHQAELARPLSAKPLKCRVCMRVTLHLGFLCRRVEKTKSSTVTGLLR